MKSTRNRHTAASKARGALAAIQEHETVPESARRHGVHANQICKGKREFLETSEEVGERLGNDASCVRKWRKRVRDTGMLAPGGEKTSRRIAISDAQRLRLDPATRPWHEQITICE
jgi:transposase-like protein